MILYYPLLTVELFMNLTWLKACLYIENMFGVFINFHFHLNHQGDWPRPLQKYIMHTLAVCGISGVCTVM